MNANKEKHERRNRDHDDPGSFEELREEEYGRGNSGHGRAKPVDGGAATPAGRSLLPPVHDEAALSEGETDEHPDREQRDQAVGVASDGYKERT